ncbi:MAG: M23 family metallopeptidase, partial [Rhodothermaceae bacterium]|nr:M23 family metallopeptidase [Rhodothermaceae bacterium]
TDPVYGTRIEEVGIDITTAPGAGVRAIFEGTVERILVMSAYGTVIVVSHGDFHSLYGNLSQVNVQQGARVQAGQAVGRAGTAEQRRGPGLFFAIFQGEQAVNPTSWLRGR